MNTTHALPAATATKTLLDSWRTLRARVLLGLGIFAGCVLVWMLITGFDVTRLTRTGPWELLSMALVCVVAQLLVGAGLRFMPADPRVANFIVLTGLVYLVCMATTLLVINMLPHWVYPYGSKQIHALNGALIASLLAPFLTGAWLVVNDMRLSALEPGRETRIRTAQGHKNIEPVSGTVWARCSYRFRQVQAWYSWRLPVTQDSQLLDAFTWPRVLVRNLLEGILLAFFVGLMTSVLIGAGLFGEPKLAYEAANRLQGQMPSWFSSAGYFLVVGAGSWVLALARRWAKWMNHSVTAATAAVWLGHLGVAGVCAYAWGNMQGLPSWLNPVVFSISIWCGMRTLSILNQRGEAIQTAQRVAASEKAVRAESAQTLALADLKALQAQIEPHFLYNTLANLQLLIRQDGARADAMTGHLIDYLRARLPLMRAHSVALAGEFELVRSYLEVLKIRMGSRLSLQLDLPDDCAQASVPPLVVMTLVENAIKHGLEPKRGGGSIVVSATRSGDWIKISVADTGVGFAGAVGTSTGGTGVGLVNIQERLRLSHPDARDAGGLGARVELLHNAPQGVIAVLHLPFIQ
ncbi:MAG: histidine kinase [Candidatus Saccharibacteria bacterium]|nr:histidine kinase [Rhodoferax sp.]